MYKQGQKRPKKSAAKQKGKLMAAIGNPILANASNKSMKIKSHKPDSNYA